MPDLHYTLLADGPSDRVLIPILNWLIHQQGVKGLILPEVADLGRFRHPPRVLSERIIAAWQLYPCDVLFIHRDAEREPLDRRAGEIQAGYDEARRRISSLPPLARVIPVRMTEAWLLFDEVALRRAAGNRRGRTRLDLPRLDSIEAIPDPKQLLHRLLRQASGLSPSRQRDIDIRLFVQALVDRIEDFAPLRALTAFRKLEEEVRQVVHAHGWDRDD